MDLDLNQYLDVFVEESREHLQNMNDILLNLEENSKDENLLNELFRSAHTLKGMAGTMGFKNMAKLTHQMEDVLQAIRSNQISINTDVVDIIFECLDKIDESINYIIENGTEDDKKHDELINKLLKLIHKEQDGINNEEKVNNNFKNESNLDECAVDVIHQAKIRGFNCFKINILLNKNCMLKSARAFIVFNTLENVSEIIQSNPPAEDIEDEKFDLSFSLTIITKCSKNEIEKELSHISELDKIEISSIEIDKVEKKDLKVKNKSKQTNNKKKNSKSNKKVNRVNKIGKTVRVDIDKLDNLMNLVSELIIIKTRMEDMSDSKSKEDMNQAIEYLERITTNLHDAVMKVRMVPIERVFNRFPRMVRDLSKKLDKKIKLEMSGEETEVDRTVIDEIGDPLVHLIRNSIDHGIEHPDERKRLGKEEIGTVKLRAYPDGNNVVIEVEDNGGGINHEKVKEKAIDKGLISASKAQDLSKNEIVNLLFKPGFSTSDNISDVSGRGVGLDVVKSKIESISGSIEVETNKGKGTKFIIRIPLSLAIIQALLIKLQHEIYAIPLSSISEITDISNKDIRNIQGEEIVLYRDKTLPIVRLCNLIGLEQSKDREESIIVIVRKGDKQAGLVVDELIGQQEIVIKPLGKYLSNIKYLEGATILGNGKISLILDVNSLF